MADGGRRGRGKLLPAKELEATAKIAGANGPQNLKPALHQIDATAVQKNGEAAAPGEGCENSTKQLVAFEVTGSRAGKIVGIKTERKIAIAETRPDRAVWKPVSVSLASSSRSPRRRSTSVRSTDHSPAALSTKAERGQEACAGAEQPEDCRSTQHAWIAEEIHQQGVGAGSGFEFSTPAIVRMRNALARSVGLLQTAPLSRGGPACDASWPGGNFRDCRLPVLCG